MTMKTHIYLIKKKQSYFKIGVIYQDSRSINVDSLHVIMVKGHFHVNFIFFKEFPTEGFI